MSTLGPPPQGGAALSRWLHLLWEKVKASGAALAVSDEGTSLTTAATSLNFTGAGVTATASGGAVTVDIPGGGGGGGTRIYAEYTAPAQVLNDVAWTIIDYSTLVENVGSGITVTTGASWRATIAEAGDYLITCNTVLDLFGGDSQYAGMIWKNGGTTGARRLSYNRWGSASTGYPSIGGSTIMKLAVGDYIDYRVYQFSGATIQTVANAFDNWIVIRKLN